MCRVGNLLCEPEARLILQRRGEPDPQESPAENVALAHLDATLGKELDQLRSGQSSC